MTNALLIAVLVIAVVVIALLAATNPMMKKREDAAIKATKDHLGKDRIKVIEPRTTAMGTDPEEAGGLRGMACLAVNEDELMAVTWSGLKEWRIPRSAITVVDTAADDPASVQKATITVTYTAAEGGNDEGEATAMFRLREPVPWLTELGFDWGPEGPPVMDDEDEADDVDDDDDDDDASGGADDGGSDGGSDAGASDD
jgi:hypothetical protein